MTIITGWRTSSRCNGGGCAEIGTFRASSRSNGTNCLEAGSCRCGVAVRDSRLEHSPVLTFSPEAWTAFTSALKAAA